MYSKPPMSLLFKALTRQSKMVFVRNCINSCWCAISGTTRDFFLLILDICRRDSFSHSLLFRFQIFSTKRPIVNSILIIYMHQLRLSRQHFIPMDACQASLRDCCSPSSHVAMAIQHVTATECLLTACLRSLSNSIRHRGSKSSRFEDEIISNSSEFGRSVARPSGTE